MLPSTSSSVSVHPTTGERRARYTVFILTLGSVGPPSSMFKPIVSLVGSATKLYGSMSVCDAMGHWIDPSWWTHLAISHSGQCSTTGSTKAVVFVILSMEWCI